MSKDQNLEVVTKDFIRITEADGTASTDYPVVHKFKVLHAGWELDYMAYVISLDGVNTRLVWSDHGKLEFISVERSGKILKSFLLDYKAAIKDTRKAIKMLGISED